MRTKQIYGVTSDLAKEIVGRTYELLKQGSLKARVESKPQFKDRLGKSPDLADAAFLCLDCARQRYGLVALDPPEDTEGGSAKFRRPKKSIKMMKDALSNPESYLP